MTITNAKEKILPKSRLKGNITILTTPITPIKKKLLSEVLELVDNQTASFCYFDLKELPQVSLVPIYQTWLWTVGEKTEETNPIFLLASLKKKLKELARKKVITLIFNLQIIYSLYESFFTNLESLVEEIDNLCFIFHFAENIKTERIKKQLGECYIPFEKIKYYPLPENYKPKSVEKFFYQLAENEQIILRQIFRKRFKEKPSISDNLDYLLKTEVIRNRRNDYVITCRWLEKFLLDEGINLVGEFKLVKKRIFFAGEDLSDKLSKKENKLVAFLVKNKGKLLSRDCVGEILWGNEWVNKSEWALDKTVSRLRIKLRILCGDSNIKVIKKGGIVLETDKKNIKSKKNQIIKTKGLLFKKIAYDKESLNYYLNLFPKRKVNKYLYSALPKTENEINLWLMNLTANSSFNYYMVFWQGKRIGHVGLKNIRLRTKTAYLGTFLYPNKLWYKPGKRVLKFILKKAKEKGLRVISYDLEKTNFREKRLALENSFGQMPGKEGKLRLEL